VTLEKNCAFFVSDGKTSSHTCNTGANETERHEHGGLVVNQWGLEMTGTTKGLSE
jgi:hypothetical protein